MQTDKLLKIVQDTLDERKGINITTLDVKDKTSVTDYMVVVTGNSSRHVKSLCNYIVENIKKQGFKPFGVEGESGAEWVLLDLGDVVVHIMTQEMRDFYQLEKLWSVDHVDQEFGEMRS